jgi:hypothetical protein
MANVLAELRSAKLGFVLQARAVNPGTTSHDLKKKRSVFTTQERL